MFGGGGLGGIIGSVIAGPVGGAVGTLLGQTNSTIRNGVIGGAMGGGVGAGLGMIAGDKLGNVALAGAFPSLSLLGGALGGGLGGGAGSPGEAAPIPKAPSPTDADTAKKMKEARDRERGTRGRASTILTGGLGVQAPAPTARNILMGA